MPKFVYHLAAYGGAHTSIFHIHTHIHIPNNCSRGPGRRGAEHHHQCRVRRAGLHVLRVRPTSLISFRITIHLTTLVPSLHIHIHNHTSAQGDGLAVLTGSEGASVWHWPSARGAMAIEDLRQTCQGWVRYLFVWLVSFVSWLSRN